MARAQGAAADQPRRPHHGRPGADRARHRGAEAAPPADASSPPTRSGARASPSPTPAPTWPRCARAPCSTATTSSSTARRCGPASRATPTGACCSCAPIPTRRSTRASRSCSSTCTAPASPCGRSGRSAATRTSTRCSSTTCACRARNVDRRDQRAAGTSPSPCLMHERQTLTFSRQLQSRWRCSDMLALARRVRRRAPGARDPLARQTLAAAVDRRARHALHGLPQPDRALRGGVPGPGGLDREALLERDVPAQLETGARRCSGPYAPAREGLARTPSTTAAGRTSSSTRAAARSPPARRRSSATSSPSACWACRGADAVSRPGDPACQPQSTGLHNGPRVRSTETAAATRIAAASRATVTRHEGCSHSGRANGLFRDRHRADVLLPFQEAAPGAIARRRFGDARLRPRRPGGGSGTGTDDGAETGARWGDQHADWHLRWAERGAAPRRSRAPPAGAAGRDAARRRSAPPADRGRAAAARAAPGGGRDRLLHPPVHATLGVIALPLPDQHADGHTWRSLNLWFLWPASAGASASSSHWMGVFGSRHLKERFFDPVVEREVRREKVAMTDREAGVARRAVVHDRARDPQPHRRREEPGAADGGGPAVGRERRVRQGGARRARPRRAPHRPPPQVRQGGGLRDGAGQSGERGGRAR